MRIHTSVVRGKPRTPSRVFGVTRRMKPSTHRYSPNTRIVLADLLIAGLDFRRANGPCLSCGALEIDQVPLRAPSASSACQTAPSPMRGLQRGLRQSCRDDIRDVDGGGGRRGGGGGGGVPVPSAVGGRRTGGTRCAFSSVLRSNSSSILLKSNRTVVGGLTECT